MPRFSPLWLVAFATASMFPTPVAAQVASVNGMIAYTVCEYDFSIGFTTCDIWAMNADGTGQTNLTNTPGLSEEGPAWSPDGTRIAYVEGLNFFNRLMAMNADGTGQVVVVGTPSYQFGPTWSADGTRIAFVRQVPGVVMTIQFDVLVANVDGTGEVNLTQSDFDELDPAWSPDGTKIAFAGVRFEESVDFETGEPVTYAQWEIVTVNPDGSGEQILTVGEPGTDRARLLEEDRFPAWSPDSNTLVFSSQGMDPCCPPWQIWSVSRDGAGAGVLSPDPSVNDGGPAYSPDGTLIVFASDRDGQSDLYTIPASATQATAVGGGVRTGDQGAGALAASPVQVTRLTAIGNAGDPAWGREPGTTPPPARFDLLVTLDLGARAGGRVASVPRGIMCGRDCSESYDAGTAVTLVALPRTGSRFAGWSGDCTGTAARCTVTMDSTKNVGARFERRR